MCVTGGNAVQGRMFFILRLGVAGRTKLPVSTCTSEYTYSATFSHVGVSKSRLTAHATEFKNKCRSNASYHYNPQNNHSVPGQATTALLDRVRLEAKSTPGNRLWRVLQYGRDAAAGETEIRQQQRRTGPPMKGWLESSTARGSVVYPIRKGPMGDSRRGRWGRRWQWGGYWGQRYVPFLGK